MWNMMGFRAEMKLIGQDKCARVLIVQNTISTSQNTLFFVYCIAIFGYEILLLTQLMHVCARCRFDYLIDVYLHISFKLSSISWHNKWAPIWIIAKRIFICSFWTNFEPFFIWNVCQLTEGILMTNELRNSLKIRLFYAHCKMNSQKKCYIKKIGFFFRCSNKIILRWENIHNSFLANIFSWIKIC